MTGPVRATPGVHSARAYCLEPDCEFIKVTGHRIADAQIRYAAQEHAKITGHRTEVAILDRIQYGPEVAS